MRLYPRNFHPSNQKIFTIARVAGQIYGGSETSREIKFNRTGPRFVKNGLRAKA